MSISNIFAIDKSSGRQKMLSILIDPDKVNQGDLRLYADAANQYDVDLFFVGGSQMKMDKLKSTVKFLKQHSKIPVILFPGSFHQVDEQADAILFLSLLSGDNPDFLVGHQKKAALQIMQSNLKVIPTAYLLIDGGNQSSVATFSKTKPLNAEHTEDIVSTALTGKYFGMNTIYLEAGSGARKSIDPALVQKVKSIQDITLIVGGGIKTDKTALAIWKAGADVVVIGNVLEKKVTQLASFIAARNSCR